MRTRWVSRKKRMGMAPSLVEASVNACIQQSTRSSGRSRSARAPEKDLSLARDRRVAGVALIGPLPDIDRDAEAKRLEVFGVDAQKGGVVFAGGGEGRQETHRRQRDDGAPHHPRPGPQL